MYFYLPVKIYEEDRCVLNHKKELAALGSKALLVTGRHSSRLNGSLDDVQTALESEGVPFVIFDAIEENPSIETVMKARDLGLKEGTDFVIGIGGGSPMDAAKAVALMLRHPQEDAGYLYRAEAGSSAVPVAEVPTTCGTGSEATPYSILTVHEKRTKSSLPHKIFPSLALLDAAYLRSAPKKVICDTAVDALGHLIESYINANASDYSRMCVCEGLKLWSRSREVLMGKREPEPEDFQNLLNASAMAGMAISHTGTSLPHGLSYYLTYELGTAHGRAVGRFLPGYLREAGQAEREFLLTASGFKSLEEFDGFCRLVCGRDELPEEIRLLALDGILSNQVKLKNCPYPVDEAVLRRIIG